MPELLTVYETGSEVLIKGSGVVGIVEKIVIGDNNAISYQLISYTPERHQLQVGAYELTPIVDKAIKQPVGFHQGVINAKDDTGFTVDTKTVTIIVDENNTLQSVGTEHNDIIINVVEMEPKETAQEIKNEKKKREKKA